MQTEGLTQHYLDYIQRVGYNPEAVSSTLSWPSTPPQLRRLVRVSGIGHLEKAPTSGNLQQTTGTGQSQLPGHGQPIRLFNEDLLIGLHGYNIRLAFLVQGKPGSIAIHVGTWSPTKRENTSAEVLDNRQKILNTVLASLYPDIILLRIDPNLVQLPRWQMSGLALGIPTIKPPDFYDNALPLDRLVRALADADWSFLVLAEPLSEQEISNQRKMVINETNFIQSKETRATGALNPLAQHYTELLQQKLASFSYGQAVGVWRTCVYLLGNTTSYYRLASVWRAIFSGDQSLLEPVRIWHSADVATLAVNWTVPPTAGPPGLAYYQHLYQYQSLLTSSQLAAYVHLPQLETNGFAVTIVPDFDVIPPPSRKEDVHTRYFKLGEIMHWGRHTQTEYLISSNALTSHCFISGVTGQGKTNTIFNLLKQAAASDIPFLVIEPAKTEYRALLDHKDLADRLRIFTLGNENISPLRLNPFEAVSWPKTPINVHLDLLRSVFNASFGMWTPLPQLLEQCLYRIYEDRGWDITRNVNHRLDSKSDIALSFPTLTDLVAKVDEVIQQVGWDEKIGTDMRASLVTRLNGLRAGGKGSMLDVQRSLPMELLLEGPTILELESMGDDDDKAFLIGLLLIRLVEYRRAQGQAKGLKHLLVIEEAHRLLANVEQHGNQEQGNPRGKAVETFANLLSEIRAYGQGIIIADQVPVKLAPDVIKNTNLKIVHRLVAEDDRKVLAGAMRMNERQANAIATLTQGQAVVFSEGDDAPLLVKVPMVKGQQDWPDDKRVKNHMAVSKVLEAYKTLLHPLAAYLELSSPTAYAASETARKLIDTPTFRRDFVRFVTSIIEKSDALDRLWPQLLLHIKGVRKRGMDEAVMQRCLMIYASEWFANRRGRQAGWTFAESSELENNLRQLLLTKLEGKDCLPALKSFRASISRLHARSFEPYSGCNFICQQTQQLCLYRYAVDDLVANAGKVQIDHWLETYDEEGPVEAWEVCKNKAYRLIEQNPIQLDAVRRIGLCYAQHMLESVLPETHNKTLQKMLNEAHATNKGEEKND